MSKLKELEKRLRDEPDNLGLRVVVAGALHEAGRRDDAVELYRSVAVAYRDQGRPQQAITVCRSILELAPDDATCKQLLATLLASQPAPRESPVPPARLSPPPQAYRPSPPQGYRPSPRLTPAPSQRPSPQAPPRLPRPPSPHEGAGEPRRRSSGDVTPLPPPLPYHVADPTSGSQQKLTVADLPPSLQEELAMYPEIAGIANAARAISASLIAASPPEDDDISIELDTRRRPRIGVDELDKISGPPPTAPVDRVPSDVPASEVGDDDPTLPPVAGAVPRTRSGDEETTEPRDQPTRTRPPSIAPPTAATGPLTGAFFAPVPPHNRAAVLQRFRRRMAASGMTVIRRGETGHGLVVVVRGQLELHVDRADGSSVALAAIAPGEYVGEISLIARAPAAASVIAVKESEILVLGAADFYEITGAFPALWAELKSVAERRTREIEQRLHG